jgi:hypothetical protein
MKHYSPSVSVNGSQSYQILCGRHRLAALTNLLQGLNSDELVASRPRELRTVIQICPGLYQVIQGGLEQAVEADDRSARAITNQS